MLQTSETSLTAFCDRRSLCQDLLYDEKLSESVCDKNKHVWRTCTLQPCILAASCRTVTQHWTTFICVPSDKLRHKNTAGTKVTMTTDCVHPSVISPSVKLEERGGSQLTAAEHVDWQKELEVHTRHHGTASGEKSC